MKGFMKRYFQQVWRLHWYSPCARFWHMRTHRRKHRKKTAETDEPAETTRRLKQEQKHRKHLRRLKQSLRMKKIQYWFMEGLGFTALDKG